MKPKKVTIPSAFIKLDTQITQPDEVFNVHDAHVFRQNHNALLAQRVRKDLISQACISVTASVPLHPAWVWKTRSAVDEDPMCRIISAPVYITQLTQQVRFWFWGCKTALDGESTLAEDPEVYCILREPHVATMVNSLTQNSVTVGAAAGTATKYTIDLMVPNRSGEHTHHHGREPWILDVYMKSHIDDTYAAHAAAAILDTSHTWFTSTVVATTTVDTAVYVDTNLAVEPRMIVRTLSLGGGVNKLFLDRPWGETPNPAVDTVTVRQILGVQMYSFGLYEFPITDFTAEGAI